MRGSLRLWLDLAAASWAAILPLLLIYQDSRMDWGEGNKHHEIHAAPSAGSSKLGRLQHALAGTSKFEQAPAGPIA